MRTTRLLTIAATMICMSATLACAATTPITADGLLLIVNKQQPAGRVLAEQYAKLRQVPDDRIVEIDVDDGIEIAPAVFESAIAETVRKEIDAQQIRDKVQCLVTFYGVPLRVQDRPVTPFEANEAKAILEPSLMVLRNQMKKSVEAVEAVATSVDPTFKPDPKAIGTEELRVRGATAERIVATALAKQIGDRPTLETQLNAARLLLTTMPPMAAAPTAKPATMPTQEQVNGWLAKPDDAESRRQLREAMYANGNVFQMLMLVESQHRALQGGEGEASVDSELSCLFLKNYPHQKWVPNPWRWDASPAVQQVRPMVMRVARIDGPTPEIARRIFEEAIATEERGLAGDVVLDARGLTGSGAPGSYDSADQSIRNVAKYLAGATELKTIFDNNAGLLPDHSSDKAAIYCGWYSVRKYQPTVKLVPGSIAWHVASFEMVSLRPENEPGWCRGLMNDGADVTIGPVSEPYLIAFPPADEMLGSMMTGKPTLAEAYWAALPITSWKMVLIGDPLYRPFAKKPVLELSALPTGLAKSLAD